MKHCWHPTGVESSDTFTGGGAREMRCCWCGTYGNQHHRTETALTSGHGQFYVRQYRVTDPVEPDHTKCTAERENQKHHPAPQGAT